MVAIIVPATMPGGIFDVAGATGGGTPTQVRVTFKASSSGTMILNNASIGIKAGAGNAWDTTATPIELKFSGVSGFNIAASASITSDWASLAVSSSTGSVASRAVANFEGGWGGYSIREVIGPITGGSPLVVIMDNNASGNTLAYLDGGGVNDASYYISGATYASATPSSLTVNGGRLYAVTLIETQ